MDLFYEECKQYEQRLREYGVQTRFHKVKRGFHAIMEAPIGVKVLNRNIWTFDMGQVEPPIQKAWASLEEFGARYLSV